MEKPELSFLPTQAMMGLSSYVQNYCCLVFHVEVHGTAQTGQHRRQEEITWPKGGPASVTAGRATLAQCDPTHKSEKGSISPLALRG